MKTYVLTEAEIKKLAVLAALPITDEQSHKLADQVGVTVGYVSTLQALNTENMKETSQVTGLENVFREDEIDLSRIFTQKEALVNAKETQNGMIVADNVFGE